MLDFWGVLFIHCELCAALDGVLFVKHVRPCLCSKSSGTAPLAFQKELKGGIHQYFTMKCGKWQDFLAWHVTSHVAHPRGEWRVTVKYGNGTCFFLFCFRFSSSTYKTCLILIDCEKWLAGVLPPLPTPKEFVFFSTWGDMLMNLIAYSAAISSCEKALPPPWFHGLGGLVFEMRSYRKRQPHKGIWMWTVFGWHIDTLTCEAQRVHKWSQTWKQHA